MLAVHAWKLETGMTLLVCAMALVSLSACTPARAGVARDECVPVELRCEYQHSPLGIDTPKPRLFWRLEDSRRGARQTAYRVVVAESREGLRRGEDLLWDTGKVESDRTIQVEYGGRPLESRRRYWWRVRVWDMNGQPSPWSEPTWWETAFLSEDDWQAEWVGLRYPEEAGRQKEDLPGEWIYPYNLIDRFEYWNETPAYHCFRKVFELPEGTDIGEAVLALQTDKPYKVWLNGEVIANEVKKTNQIKNREFPDELDHMDPPVERLNAAGPLRKGENVLAVKLYKPERTPLATMRCGLRVETADGPIVVRSDRSWMAVAAEDPEVGSKGGPVPYIKELVENWNRLSWENEDLEGWGIKRWYHADGSGPVHPMKNRRSIYLRRDFSLEPGIERARIYVTALGVHEVWLNGHRVSRDVFAPGKGTFDHYHVTEGGVEFFDDPSLGRRLLNYQVYDVTEQVQKGRNAVGAILGNGWYNSVGLNLSYRKPLLLLQLEVTYRDGSREVITSDRSWQAHPSPVLFDSMYYGEIYDARREEDGWSEPGFDATEWSAASAIEPDYNYHYAESGAPELVAENAEPIRVTVELEPGRIEKLGDGRYRFHFGQIASGFCRLKVRDAEPGTKISISYLHYDDIYVCRGGEEEVWQKRFGYGLLRDVEVSGYPGEPEKDAVTFLVVHNDLPRTGTFECSKEVLNAIWEAVRWTMRGNVHSVPVDCDREKIFWPWAGWSFGIGSAAWQMDLSRFVPRMFQMSGGPGKNLWCAGWGDGAVFHPYRAMVFYGDRRFAEQEYEHMKHMVERRIGPDYFWPHGSFGDWHGLNQRGESGGMFGAAHHYVSLWQLSRMAEWLDKEQDARRYHERLPKVARAFSEKLLDRDKMTYPGNNQRALTIPLCLDFPPPDAQDAVEENFLHMVVEGDEFLKNHQPIRPVPYDRLRTRCLDSGGESLDYHPTVGIYGQPWLLWSLTHVGRHDVAYRMATLTSYPSRGHVALEGGAISETYNPGYSHMGRINTGAWIYETVGGIRPDPSVPGFRRIVIKPRPAGDLRWARATYDSPHGTIESRWRLGQDGAFNLHVTVPPNTTALVYLPFSPDEDVTVTEGGVPVEKAGGVQPVESIDLPSYWWADTTAGRPEKQREVRSREQFRAYRVKAGTYEFRVSN